MEVGTAKTQIARGAAFTLLFAIALSGCGGGGSPPAVAPSSPLSNDSAATDIVLSDVELDQNFQPSLLNYSATTSPSDSTTTVTVSLSDANATMTVNGAALEADVASEKITLHPGNHAIAVKVTAEDDITTTSYEVDVTRLSTVNLARRAYIKASNTDVSDGDCGEVVGEVCFGADQFGYSVALDGDTLAVGAPREDSNATGINGDQGNNEEGYGSGAVYVYTRDPSGVWSQQAYIKASNTGGGFGRSVALDGETLVVGAPYEDSNATGIEGDQGDNSASASGAVYVFTRDINGDWSQQAYIKASNAESEDRFGWSVALDGDTLAVGATGELSSATGIDGDQTDNSFFMPDRDIEDAAGAVYVFTRDASGVWSQQAYVKASNTGQDWFGYSVALGGDTLAVGATFEGSNATGVNGDQADNSASTSGAAYVFTRDINGAWSQQAYVKASNTERGDFFGESIALAGDTLAVGASWEDSNATGVDGDQADNSAFASGAVYVFTRDDSGAWSQQAFIKASNTELRDFFGTSLALDGDTLVVGAPQEDSIATDINGDPEDNSAGTAGAAYLFTRDASGVWSYQAYIKASNTDAHHDDYFGWSVALDGDTLAVGAKFEDSNAVGIEGDQADNSSSQAGAVYVFK